MVTLEDKTNKGRIDLAARIANEIYIIEFKLDGSAEAALSQIKIKGYSGKFLRGGKRIHLAGINFSTELRNIEDYREEIITQQS